VDEGIDIRTTQKPASLGQNPSTQMKSNSMACRTSYRVKKNTIVHLRTWRTAECKPPQRAHLRSDPMPWANVERSWNIGFAL
jgi:hypothetical protein